MAQTQQAYEETGTIIHRLAETIDDEGLRVGFVTAVAVQSILASCRKSLAACRKSQI